MFSEGRTKMQEKLTKVWKQCETKELAKIFKSYMKSISVRNFNASRKDNTNTYLVDGITTSWNRVECYYHKDSATYGQEELKLVLRKRAGNYFIIGKGLDRAFEVDCGGIKHYDEQMLSEIIKEHEPLFQELFDLIA